METCYATCPQCETRNKKPQTIVSSIVICYSCHRSFISVVPTKPIPAAKLMIGYTKRFRNQPEERIFPLRFILREK